MNKKILIITTAILFVTLIGVGFIFYLRSFKTVYFDIKSGDISITVYKGDEQKLASLDKSGNLTLQSGDYIFVTEGKNYDNMPTSFNVRDIDITIPVDPPYSAAYRNTILTAELPAITKVIKAAYPTVITNFNIDRGNIYQDGEWYATTLAQITARADEQGDVYRTVLRKERDRWVIKAKPALVLSSLEYSTIPIEILSDINIK